MIAKLPEDPKRQYILQVFFLIYVNRRGFNGLLSLVSVLPRTKTKKDLTLVVIIDIPAPRKLLYHKQTETSQWKIR